jgi:hypothetical protein
MKKAIRKIQWIIGAREWVVVASHSGRRAVWTEGMASQ